LSRGKKRELRGIQVNPDLHYSGSPYYHKGDQIRDLTIDCHLGSLVLTKDEILDYLEQRGNGRWEFRLALRECRKENKALRESEDELLKMSKEMFINLKCVPDPRWEEAIQKAEA